VSKDKESAGEEIVVPISSLRFGESPRLVPEDLEHARMLAEIERGELPPILVQAETMTVIAGRHLVLAARLRGDRSIRAQMFHGNKDEAFILAVRSNSAHGKPLSLPERLTAVSHMLEFRPGLSDREIASICGLSPKTVADRRKLTPNTVARAGVRETGGSGRLTSRVTREKAAELMRAFPGESNRKIAREVGLSEATVRDVRHQMERGSGDSK
jgi:DNA-binding NarL/FixJ family response regulator